MAIGITVFLSFSVTASLLEEFHWFFSLITHFREWFIVSFLILICTSLWVTRFRKTLLSVSFGCAIFHMVNLAPYWVPSQKKLSVQSEQAKPLKIFFANINFQNNKKNLLVKHLKREQPDIVLLIEVSEAWMEELTSLRGIYPYSKAIVKDDNFGMAALSKTPLQVREVFVDRLNVIPALFLSSKVSASSLNLVLLHPFPPIGEYGTLMRNHYLEVLSRQVRDLEPPLLLCGDFNTTPWTAIFQKFIKWSKLELVFTGILPRTWPTALPILRLPIDHCMTKGLKVTSYNKGPDINSDHWPLSIEALIDGNEKSHPPNRQPSSSHF